MERGPGACWGLSTSSGARRHRASPEQRERSRGLQLCPEHYGGGGENPHGQCSPAKRESKNLGRSWSWERFGAVCYQLDTHLDRMEDPAWRGAGCGFSACIWHHEALSQADLCPHAEEKAPAISCEPKPLPGQAYKKLRHRAAGPRTPTSAAFVCK